MLYRSGIAVCVAALLWIPTVAGGWQEEEILRRPEPNTLSRESRRPQFAANLDRKVELGRNDRAGLSASESRATRATRRATARPDAASRFGRRGVPAAVISPASTAGTGSGDIFEIEPNDPIAQNVFMPANVAGAINPTGDVDFFAFPVLAGQEVNVEAFAARFVGSILVADIALFDASGTLLTESAGSDFTDPVIRFIPDQSGVLIAGITDIDGLGGSSFQYLLSIEAGVDVQEVEPNDRVAQGLPALPVTVFGSIDNSNDVDFYSFTGVAGETLIVDVDAAVLGSSLDAEINLTDTNGVQYFYNDQYDGDDPRFNIVLPFTGTFIVGIDAFNGSSRGFYRLNFSLVPGDGAPIITSVSRLSKKLVQVTGAGFTSGSIVEINGVARSTVAIDSNTLQARAKARIGSSVTVSNLPDDRRSNPLIIQN